MQQQEVLILHMLLYKEIAGNYAMKVRALILRLLAAVSEALGLNSSYLDRIFRKHTQLIDIMYYPPCSKPDITLGTPRHSDVRGITVLMQGEVEVSGLQVLKNGKWIAVEPIPNAFVVNMGDQLQVFNKSKSRSNTLFPPESLTMLLLMLMLMLIIYQVVSNGNLTMLLLMLIICQVVSNGRLRSVEHRAVTNVSAAHISIPTFYSPSEDALVDEQHPARYKGYKFGEFMRIFWSQELKNKTVLDHFKIEYTENNSE